MALAGSAVRVKSKHNKVLFLQNGIAYESNLKIYLLHRIKKPVRDPRDNAVFQINSFT
jgi:hypothetical protein